MGIDEGERGHFGLVGESEPGFGSLAAENEMSLQVMEVKNFLLGTKKHLNVLGLGALEFSFPQIYEISCISPTPPVKKKNNII